MEVEKELDRIKEEEVVKNLQILEKDLINQNGKNEIEGEKLFLFLFFLGELE